MEKRQISKIDGTNKFLFCLKDGNMVESVLMKYKHGNSVCIYSQVGCRMGCRFCASTIGGLTRNLLPSEMLDQVYRIQELTGERVSNVVVMGTGEPLDNYDTSVCRQSLKSELLQLPDVSVAPVLSAFFANLLTDLSFPHSFLPLSDEATDTAVSP